VSERAPTREKAGFQKAEGLESVRNVNTKKGWDQQMINFETKCSGKPFFKMFPILKLFSEHAINFPGMAIITFREF